MTRILAFVFSTLFALSAFAAPHLIVFGDQNNTRFADPGATATYTVYVRNNGTDATQNATLILPFPPGSTFLSLDPPDGWTCGATGIEAICVTMAVPPTGYNPAPHLTATVQLPSDLNGFVWSDSARVSSVTPDAFPNDKETTLGTAVYRTFIVKTSGDSGDDTLRAAIESANARCSEGVPCKIRFDVSTIAPLVPLPAIDAGWLIIDGKNTVELDGANLERGNGLEIRSTATPHGPESITIDGLTINRFPDFGIATTGSGDARLILQNLAISACGRGIGEFNPRNIIGINNDAISGNTHSGVFAWSSLGTSISGCAITGNGNSGVFEYRGSMDIEGSTISYNAEFGVAMEPEVNRASISGTRIFANGIDGIDWGLDGPGSSRVPPPIISDALYDAASDETVITGTIAAADPLTRVEIFANNGETILGSLMPIHSAFTLRTKGDLRGQIITATLSVGPYADSVTFLTSEFSPGIEAR